MTTIRRKHSKQTKFKAALGSKLAFSGVLIYCFTHALEKTALFLAAGYLIASSSSGNLNTYAGIARNHPWISSIIMVNLLSSVGFPLTAGFIGKWEIFKASLATDIWFMLVIMLSALFTFIYAFRFAEILLFKKSHEHKAFVLSPVLDKTCLWIMSIITILNLYLGINSQYLLSIW